MRPFHKLNAGSVSVLFALMAISSTAFAGHNERAEFDLAQVISVDPIIEYVNEPIEHEVCWDEPVTYRETVHQGRRHRSNTGAVLGAILGGVIGNQFGDGDGRTATTVAGAALGYSVARDEQRRNHGVYSDRVYEQNQQRCRIETDYQRQERVNGYDVAYRYNGRVYHTQTDYHPGETIRVEVQVVPVP